jgi:hypothetical protein
MTGIMLAPQMPLEEPLFLAFFCYTALALYTGAEHALAARAARRQEVRR